MTRYVLTAQAQHDLKQIRDYVPRYSYLIVYQPDVDPIRIMAVLRGTRNVKRILKRRP